ncbi:hypothetical protein HYDPIDRAFT_33040 [Hydnomerulius pinastri MD-312]|uniref:Uncharacterized protein n=1 Tax=Hydnomerulius pinastri MD-312 TaxID=994086 RepID=A0A0C9VPJ1_9AGAM|nr:hypothetical protein HYDPIDRAFT_33040 [Hydnomerulius pinastri MD-312]
MPAAQNAVLVDNHEGADTPQSQEIEGSAVRFENLAQGIGAPCIVMPSAADVPGSFTLIDALSRLSARIVFQLRTSSSNPSGKIDHGTTSLASS